MLLIRQAATVAPLLDRLADTIARQRRGDPLATVDLVVPSPGAEARLLASLTERLGVASGIAVHLIENWFASRLPAEDRNRRLTADDLRLDLVALMDDDESLSAPELEPLRRTLDRAPGAAARRRRRDVLAARLAPLFEEYALTRPEMMDAWRRGEEPTNRSALVAWQSATFAALFRRRAERGETADRFLVELLGAARPLEEGEAVFFIAPGFLAPRYREVLATLDGAGLIEVAQLEFPIFVGGGAVVLEEWTRPATLFTSNLRDEAAASIKTFDDPRAPDSGLLVALQSGFGPTTVPGDPSLRVIDAPGSDREAGLVADAVARALGETRNDERPLRPWDILVLAAGGDAESQLSRIAAALATRGPIPSVEVDAPAGRASSFPRGVEAILDLLASRFDRERCVTLFRNPSFRAARAEADPARWEDVLAELDVRHGRDARDHEGSYLPGDLFHWDQALARLGLGALAAPRDPDEGPLVLGPRRLFPGPESLELEERGRLAGVVRQLMKASRELAEGPPRSASAWMAAFILLVEELLAVAPGEPEGIALRTVSALRSAGAGDTASSIAIDFTAAADRVREALKKVRIRPGASALRGVALASLGALRPPTARMIVITGLDEGAFPASAVRDGLDLRREAPRPEEYDARHRDLQRFSEALIGAEERLVLSYRGRDPRGGDPREPASPLRALIAWGQGKIPVLKGGLDPARGALSEDGEVGGADDGREHPSSDDALFDAEARAEATAATWGRAETRGRVAPDAASRTFFREIPALASTTPWPTGRGALVRDARLLEDFLACPLQASARVAGGLREEEEDVSADGDEPFEVGPRTSTRLYRESLEAALLAGEPETAAERLEDLLHEVNYRAPGWSAGVFHDQDRRALLRRLDRAITAFREAGIPAEGFRRPELSLAATEETSETRPALDLRLTGPDGQAPIDLRVIARGDLFRISDEEYEWVRVLRSAPAAADLARAYVQAAWGAAAGFTDGRPGRAVFVAGGSSSSKSTKGTCRTVALPAISREVARDWLSDRFGELLGTLHAELLPIEVLHEVLPPERRAHSSRNTVPSSLREALELAASEGGRQTARGPLRRWRRIAPPPLETARQRLRIRFGIFHDDIFEEALA